MSIPRLPPKNTFAYRIVRALYKRSPMTLDELVAAVPDVPRKTLTDAASKYDLCGETRGTYELPGNLRRMFSDSLAREDAATAPIVPLRSVNIMGQPPMRGYDAAMRAACHREQIGEGAHLNGDTVAEPFRGITL